MALRTKQVGQSGVPGLLGIAAGITVGLAVTFSMPGAACVDGSSSPSIGRSGACSHHGGVARGSGWLGIPAGFFAGLLVYILAGNVIDPMVERREAARLARPAPSQSVNSDDKEAVLRAAARSSSQVEFLYQGGGAASERRRVYPRWLKMAMVEGEVTLCVMASEELAGNQQPWALSRMSSLKSLPLLSVVASELRSP